MISRVLTLIQTLLEIIFLRKGPEALPRAPIIFVVVVALILLSDVASLAIVESYTQRTFLLDLILSIVSVLAFAAVIQVAGKMERMRQTLSAILGCGALFSFISLLFSALSPALLDENQVQVTIALVWLWSLIVEGHIIARAIDRLWYVGFVAALAVLAVQLFLLSALEPVIDPKPAVKIAAVFAEPS